MSAEALRHPLLPEQSVDENSGRLCARAGEAVMFEPLHVEAGEMLLPRAADTEYRLALYTAGPEPRYLYTYSYPPEGNLTGFLPGASSFAWRRGPYRFSAEAHVRVIVRIPGETPAALEDCFERQRGPEPPIAPWIDEEAERVARRVRKARRDGDAVFLLLSDTHYAAGCNWADTARSLACVQARIGAEGILHLGDLTDGLLPAAWTKRYTARVTDGMRALGLPVWGCLGNHDRNYFRGNTQPLSRLDCMRLCLGRDDPDYCVDRAEQRLRMIFLDSFEPERRERYGFSEETLKRFERMLRETPEGWRVLVFSHLPPVARLHVWSDSILGSAEATGLLRRFQREHGGVLGWVHGHNHCDQIDRGEGFPIVSIGCSKLEAFPEYKPLGSVTPMRYPDEPRQELWDVLLIHARGDDFELIRYGAGADRYIHL